METFVAKRPCEHWFQAHFHEDVYRLQLPAVRGKRELALLDVIFWQRGNRPIDMCRWHTFFTDRLRNYALQWRGVRASDGIRWTLQDDVKSLDWTLLEHIAKYAMRNHAGTPRKYTWDRWCTTRENWLHVWRRRARRRTTTSALDLPNAWRLDRRPALSAAPFRPHFYEPDLDSLHDQGYAAPVTAVQAAQPQQSRGDDIVFDAFGEASQQTNTGERASTDVHFVATAQPTSALRATDTAVRTSDVATPLLLPLREDRDLHFLCQRPWHTCQSRNFLAR